MTPLQIRTLQELIRCRGWRTAHGNEGATLSTLFDLGLVRRRLKATTVRSYYEYRADPDAVANARALGLIPGK